MADAVILEFDGVTQADYDAVNENLGLGDDGQSWPTGIKTHFAGFADSGKFLVVEVWESRQAQEEFMQSRLGAALGAAGVSAAPTVTWLSLIADERPDR